MTSIGPYGIRVPMLLGGAIATDLAPQLLGFGMDVKVVSPDIGVASAIKMSRSVMIKGLEALVIESYTTARQYGVEDHVLPTLAETFPALIGNKQARIFQPRGATRQTSRRRNARICQHGQRSWL